MLTSSMSKMPIKSKFKCFILVWKTTKAEVIFLKFNKKDILDLDYPILQNVEPISLGALTNQNALVEMTKNDALSK